VFWALLFLAHQGKVELEQQGGLYGPLQLRRLLEAGESRQLPLTALNAGSEGSAQGPSHETLAA
jgi:segregation and condensation protein A